MSVVTLGKDAPKLSHDEVKTVGAKGGIAIKEAHIDDFARLLGALDQSVEDILHQDDYTPKPNLEKYPRTEMHKPEDTDKGGWAIECVAKCTSPKSEILKGKTIALKDNIALAGMPCTNGTTAMEWNPDIDATIATRIMDAGGVITGKAACENACLEGVSDTSCTGKVHNPYADNYSCGGSSSGSGRLVATGSVDMAIGCDQGGSIRIPSCMCGLVGHKPTWGLVPYTGIVSMDGVIDHAGPMTKTVRDAALLLDAIAGPDGKDDRQPPFLPDSCLNFTSKLDSFLESVDPKKSLTGVKIGLLEEGFTIPGMDPNIRNTCSAAVDKLRDLGAEVKSISMPSHHQASIVWMCSIPISGARQGLMSDMTGRKQLYMADRVVASGKEGKLSQKAFDALSPGGQNLYLRYVYLADKYGPELHAKCWNLLQKISDEYDHALSSVDVLVMPTLPSPPCKLFDEPSKVGPLERLSRNVGLVGNTSPFNSTGHPALTIPVGFVPAQDNEKIKLPTGLQLVGKKFTGDIECLKVGAAFEKAYDWKTL